MAYKTMTVTYEAISTIQHSITCDVCGKHLTDDNGVSSFLDMDDADFAADDMGWHRYEQPDGDPRHLCPGCAEKEDMR